MAHRIRSLLADKVVQVLEALTNGARQVKPATLLPYIQVDPQASQPIEFKVSLKDLQQDGIIPSGESVVRFGSSAVQVFQTDPEVPAVYTRHTRTDTRLNIKVSPGPVVEAVVGGVVERPDDFWRHSGLVNSLPPQRVLVEYSSPNIAKPFHIGHLRSTIIGNFVGNVNAAMGHPVTRINYLGDWGTQFGLLKYGFDGQNLSQDQLLNLPSSEAVARLNQAYVWANRAAADDPTVTQAARETFTRMEEGDEEEMKAWRVFREVSVRDLKRVYQRLNVRFDEFHGESLYPKEVCRGVMQELESAGLVRTLEDGRKVYEVKPGHQVTLEKSDGSSLYLTRDIAAAADRYRRYRFTRMFYVVEKGQKDHFGALFSLLGAMGHPWAGRLTHLTFGRVRGMSSRQGTAVDLEDLLNGAGLLMGRRQRDSKTSKVSALASSTMVAEELAVSSVIVGDLRQRRQRDYEFDWDKALQVAGDTGVRLQYTHCRLVSLSRHCGVTLGEGAGLAPLVEPPALALVVELARYDEVLVETYKELEPCILLAYLFRLCSVTSSALKHLPVKGSSPEVALARLALFTAARHTLAQGMAVLGLRPMTEM